MCERRSSGAGEETLRLARQHTGQTTALPAFKPSSALPFPTQAPSRLMACPRDASQSARQHRCCWARLSPRRRASVADCRFCVLLPLLLWAMMLLTRNCRCYCCRCYTHSWPYSRPQATACVAGVAVAVPAAAPPPPPVLGCCCRRAVRFPASPCKLLGHYGSH